MRLTINRDVALAEIAFARNAALRRSTIPILGALLVRASDGEVEFVGTDLDIESAATATADVEEPGSVALDAERLFAALQSLPVGSDVRVSDDKQGGRIVVQHGRTRFQIPALDTSSFPTFGAADEIEFGEIGANDCERLIDATEFAVSREMTRPYVTGIHLHEVGGRLRAVGTNTAVLSFEEVDCPASLSGRKGQTIPLKCIGQLRLMTQAGGTIRVGQSDALFYAKSGSKRLVSKIIDQAFPDYIRIVPADPPQVCTLSREEFATSVKRCLAASEDRAPAVRLSIASDAVALSSRGGFGEEADDAIEAQATGPFMASFNGRLLLEIAARFSGSDLAIRYGDSLSPVTFSSPENPDGLVVITSLRGS